MHCGRMKMLTLASGLIASVLVFSFLLKVPQVHAQISCNYYASPNGTGNGRSPSTPFQISKFWSVATPGKTLCLLNGTYTDDNSLIQVPPTFAGTASQPIRIRALNDGKVLIDSGKRRPIDLQGSYGILEGINVQGADNAALRMRGSHWTARRVMVWNNGPNDDQLALADLGGNHNTLEDCAIFGKGRIVLTGSSQSGPTYKLSGAVGCGLNFAQGPKVPMWLVSWAMRGRATSSLRTCSPLVTDSLGAPMVIRPGLRLCSLPRQTVKCLGRLSMPPPVPSSRRPPCSRV